MDDDLDLSYLDTLISNGLITNTYNKLIQNRITTREQLIDSDWVDLFDLRGIGLTGLESLVIAMALVGDRLKPYHHPECAPDACQCPEKYWTQAAEDARPGSRPRARCAPRSFELRESR